MRPAKVALTVEDDDIGTGHCRDALSQKSTDARGKPANLYEADLCAFPLGPGLYSQLNGPNTPSPKVVFGEDLEGADSHGAALTKHGRYLWVADRGRNFLWVVDTARDVVANRIDLVPALGAGMFMSMRGPNPLSADPHVSSGANPGVGVLRITEGGRNGVFEFIAPMSNKDSGGVERADAHALWMRAAR